MLTSTADLAADLAALNEYRVEHDWTWRHLSDEMRAAGYFVHMCTLIQLVRSPSPSTRDRTAYKIRRYLATLQITRRRPRRASAAEARA